MKNLIEVVQDAGRNCVAIGHFNIADLVLLKGIFEAARELNVPVIVGASEGERAFAGTQQLAALVRSLREEFDHPIFLNADHTHSLAGGLEAVKAGFDSVVFDLSTLPLEENAQSTKEAVEAFKSMNPAVVVEGEIGDIGSGSEIHADGPGPERALTTPAEARQFVTETKVDVLAPAVGNSHGMRKSMVTGRSESIWRSNEFERSNPRLVYLLLCMAVPAQPMTISGGRSTPGSISFTSTRNCVWPGNRDLRLVSRVARTRWCRTRSSRRPSPRSTTSCAPGFDYSEGRTKGHSRLRPSGMEHQRRCTASPPFGFRLIGQQPHAEAGHRIAPVGRELLA